MVKGKLRVVWRCLKKAFEGRNKLCFSFDVMFLIIHVPEIHEL